MMATSLPSCLSGAVADASAVLFQGRPVASGGTRPLRASTARRARASFGAGAAESARRTPAGLQLPRAHFTASMKKAALGTHPLQSPNSSGMKAAHGLGFDHTAESSGAVHCGTAAACAMMPASGRMAGCVLGGALQTSSRRMTAAPSRSRDVAFLFGGCPTHGLIAPAWLQICGLMPCGNPSGLPSPATRSANPHGVAHLLAEVSALPFNVAGAHHE